MDDKEISWMAQRVVDLFSDDALSKCRRFQYHYKISGHDEREALRHTKADFIYTINQYRPIEDCK